MRAYSMRSCPRVSCQSFSRQTMSSRCCMIVLSFGVGVVQPKSSTMAAASESSEHRMAAEGNTSIKLAAAVVAELGGQGNRLATLGAKATCGSGWGRSSRGRGRSRLSPVQQPIDERAKQNRWQQGAKSQASKRGASWSQESYHLGRVPQKHHRIIAGMSRVPGHSRAGGYCVGPVGEVCAPLSAVPRSRYNRSTPQ
jgi:hypothetical protein